MNATPEAKDPREEDAEAPVRTIVTEESAERVEGGEIVDERVAALLDADDVVIPDLAEAVEAQEAPDAAVTLEHLNEEEATEVIAAMDDQSAADAIAEMQIPLAAGIIEDLLDEGETAYATDLLRRMATDDAVDLLQALPDSYRERALTAFSLAESKELRRLVGYPADSAAGLMTVDYLALTNDQTVSAATEAIRRAEIPAQVNHLPVIDEKGHMTGIVGLRDLLLAPESRRIGDVMDRSFRAVRAGLDQESVASEFEKYDLVMLPVVDDADRLLGLITVDDVIEIIREEETEDAQRTVGAGAGEAVFSGVGEKLRGRFPWLVVSSLLSVPASLIVLHFEWLIADLAVLAGLMPMIAALTGNAGNQALAVTLRGIVLNEVRPDRVAPLIRREFGVGLLNGAMLGVLIGLGVLLLSLFVDGASWRLGVVVSIAMPFAMGIGTLSGALLPIVLRRLGADPAQSSVIFLIMITDATSFASFLGLAFVLHDWLIDVVPSVAAG